MLVGSAQDSRLICLLKPEANVFDVEEVVVPERSYQIDNTSTTARANFWS